MPFNVFASDLHILIEVLSRGDTQMADWELKGNVALLVLDMQEDIGGRGW